MFLLSVLGLEGIDESLLDILWMDKIHFAPPFRNSGRMIPLQIPTNKWFPMVSKWCEMDVVHPQHARHFFQQCAYPRWKPATPEGMRRFFGHLTRQLEHGEDTNQSLAVEESSAQLGWRDGTTISHGKGGSRSLPRSLGGF